MRAKEQTHRKSVFISFSFHGIIHDKSTTTTTIIIISSSSSNSSSSNSGSGHLLRAGNPVLFKLQEKWV